MTNVVRSSEVALEHPDLPGVMVRPYGQARRGQPQKVLVSVPAGGKIPLHTHDADAEMLITRGSGAVLADDDTNGHAVESGTLVFFAKHQPHGFEAGPDGLEFVSLNEGIADPDPAAWDMKMVA